METIVCEQCELTDIRQPLLCAMCLGSIITHSVFSPQESFESYLSYLSEVKRFLAEHKLNSKG